MIAQCSFGVVTDTTVRRFQQRTTSSTATASEIHSAMANRPSNGHRAQTVEARPRRNSAATTLTHSRERISVVGFFIVDSQLPYTLTFIAAATYTQQQNAGRSKTTMPLAVRTHGRTALEFVSNVITYPQSIMYIRAAISPTIHSIPSCNPEPVIALHAIS